MSATEIPRANSPSQRASDTPGRDGAGFATLLEGDAVLVCSGELDPATRPQLRQALQRVLRLGPDRLVVDLRSVSFFDAGALGELVRARNASRDAGSDLVIRSPSVLGRRVLGIVGLTNLIDSDPIEDAVAGRSAGSARGAVRRTPGMTPNVVSETAAGLADEFAAGNRAGVVVDEAKGLIAEHFGIGIEEATTVLHRFSATQGNSLVPAAAALMDQRIDVARLAPLRTSGSPTAPDESDPAADTRLSSAPS